MAVLLIFLDGFGLGRPDPIANPVASAGTRLRWLRVFEGVPLRTAAPEPILVPTDACLGCPGLPQSATGQTTLLTGLNAPGAVGRHINGFCTPSLSRLLSRGSIFTRVRALGGRATFANAYTPPFFEGRRRFQSVSTVAVREAGLRFRDLDDLRRGRAVYQDFTNELLIAQGYAVDRLAPEEAGRRLAALAAECDFTLYEYFQTDRAGHGQDHRAAARILGDLDRLVDAVLALVDLDRTLVVLTSDHGNIEDLTTRTHTRNRVPTLLWGRGSREVARRIDSLADVAGAILPWAVAGGTA